MKAIDTRTCDPAVCECLPRAAFGAEDEVLLRHPAWGLNHHIHARRRDLGSVIRMHDLRVEEVTRVGPSRCPVCGGRGSTPPGGGPAACTRRCPACEGSGRIP